MMFDALNQSEVVILKWIQENLSCGVLDFLMPIFSFICDAGICWIAMAVVMALTKKERKTGFSAGLALLIGVIVVNLVLKNVFCRVRPYDIENAITPLLISPEKYPTDFSFPSGHTLASFEAATAVFIRNKKYGSIAFFIAVLISFSRLYLSVHYPTDVIFAAVLGTAIAFLASYIVDLIYKKVSEKKSSEKSAG